MAKNKDDNLRLRTEINRNCQSWPISQHFRHFNNGRYCFSPWFQRGARWSRDKQISLIDTIVKGGVIPPIYGVRQSDGTYIIVDGKQRLDTTLFPYLNDEFYTVGLDPIIFDVLEDKKPTGETIEYDINGKVFSELDPKVQTLIKEYPIPFYILESVTGGQLSDDITRMVFNRLNNGVALSRKERNVANCSDFANIMEIGKHELFQAILTDKARESKNQVTILMKMHMMLFCEDLQEISFGPDDMTEALTETYTTEYERKTMRAILDKMLVVYNMMDEKKTIRKRWSTETHLVSLAPWFRRAIEEGIPDGMLVEFLSEAYATKDPISAAYTEFSRSGSGKTHAIVGRNAEIARVWDNFFGNGEEDSNDNVEAEETEEPTVDEVESIDIGSENMTA